ncbi:uncharacterized protein LOC111380475 [Olea europaea var. sylvestris]|uniref:uncharacterized protein LOC111380475 n=1 Tax=Olea europaea var. sylvestris TaxID=158386 RepID=UPI000C1D3A1F|nr:uncharacterized protein LOC111380475 [Olea europaea var. sylvestris]
MQYNLLLRLHHNHSPSLNLNRSIPSSFLIFTKFPLFSTMASSSLVLPSISLRRSSISTSSLGFKNDVPRISVKNLDRRGRVFMSIAVGSQSTVVDDALFNDYRPSRAFLFPGQGAQAVGMGVEAQKVPAAAELYKRANDILGFDLLDVCINGPKEKLDSTVLSQVCHHCLHL